MGWFTQKWFDCCGGEGRHINGCDGNLKDMSPRKRKEVTKRKNQAIEYRANQTRQKARAKLKNVGKPRSTDFMNAEIPDGHHSEKTDDGRYVIVKNGQHWNR